MPRFSFTVFVVSIEFINFFSQLKKYWTMDYYSTFFRNIGLMKY
jgi:hypothetical protein